MQMQIVGVGFHISKFPVLVIRRINACQPSQGGDEHSPCQGGVRTKGGFACAGEQPAADCKQDVFLGPMTIDVGEVRNRVLVAYAVDTKMLCFKNHGFLVRVITGLGEPLYLAFVVHIDRIQVSSLFVCRRGIGQFDGNRLALPIGEGHFLAAFDINQRELINWSCSNRRLCLSGSDRCFGNPQNQIPSLGLGIQHLQGIQRKSERGQAVCSNLKPAYLCRHQLVQRLCLDGDGMAKFEYMQRAFSSELKPRARLVLQVLVLHCNKEGECFPSIKTIAAKCGYGVSTVKRALDELVKAGYIVKQARFDERKNGGQTSNLYTLCSDLLCPDEPENAPVLEDDASDESPAVQPESAPADACNASDPTPGEQSATLPTADSYSFADGFETKIGRQFCRPIRMWTGGQSIFIPP